jgi:hypothetical protein
MIDALVFHYTSIKYMFVDLVVIFLNFIVDVSIVTLIMSNFSEHDVH